MKVCIFGLGAIGSHLAARLVAGGANVSAVARGKTLEAVREAGLRFHGYEREMTVRLDVYGSAAELGHQDVVIVALKSYALHEAVTAIKPLVGPDTLLIYAVNGIPWWYFHKHDGVLSEYRLASLDPAGRLWDELGVERSLGMVVYSANMVSAPGVVHNKTAENRFLIGEPATGMSERLERVFNHLSPALPDLQLSTDIRQPLWQKLLMNLPGSLLGCLAHASGAEIANRPELRQLFLRVAAEAAQVAQALGVNVLDDTQMKLKRMAGAGHRSSMLQDLLAGRRIEFDGQIDALRQIASRLDIELPLINPLADLLANRTRSVSEPDRCSRP